jgi:MraZ protein
MPAPQDFILGEFPRTLDERHRLSIPTELVEPLLGDLQSGGGSECILAKERPGCLSLWNSTQWQDRLDAGVSLVRSKMQAGRLEGKLEEVQLLGRLLSTRHKTVQLAGRGRLSIPDGFREFLGTEQGGEVIVVGAGVCVEIWNPPAWLAYLEARMPEFRQLFDKLSS